MNVQYEIKISLLFVICLVGVGLILIFKPFSRDLTPSNINWTQIHTQLDSLSYTQADPVQYPILPDSVPTPPELVTSTTSGSGTWIAPEPIDEGDTLEVELSQIVLEDGSAWSQVTIDGEPVLWEELTYYQAPAPERRVQAHAEVCNCDSARLGVGMGYRLFTVAEVDVVPALSISIRADWIAPEVRLSHTVWSGVAVGLGGGYRLGVDEGLHLSAGLSLEL